MRTNAGSGALFYIGSASPEAVKERLVLSTGMRLSLGTPLVDWLGGMRAGKKTSPRLLGRNFEIVKHRHRWDFDIVEHGQPTRCRGSFSVFDFYLLEPDFSKAKKKNETRLE